MTPLLPYAGIPALEIALLIACSGRLEAFFLLQRAALTAFGYAAAVSDVKSKTIPNGLVLAMLAGWVITAVPRLFADTGSAIPIFTGALAGFALGGGLFLLAYLISRKGLGGGDVKFMAAAGLYLGFDGVLPAMLCGTVLAGIAGLALILLKKIGRKDAIPLAPFLYAGILMTVFFM